MVWPKVFLVKTMGKYTTTEDKKREFAAGTLGVMFGMLLDYGLSRKEILKYTQPNKVRKIMDVVEKKPGVDICLSL